MRLLLDTHIFIWCVQNSPHLSKATKSYIQSAEEVFVSSISMWEASIKIKLGKLNASVEELAAAITLSNFKELPFVSQHAIALTQLSDIHRDPFDRALIAQAICEPLKFLTADKILKEYSELVKVV